MPETLTPVEYERQDNQESRFGDHAEILELMNHGEPRILGRIEDIVPLVNAHSNVVELAELSKHQPIVGERVNKAELVFFNDPKQQIFGVFKPFDGENEEIRGFIGYQNFYTHEHAAYLVSQHFGFDLVPPTTVRIINGRVGALQLFMLPDEFQTGENLASVSDDEWENLKNSDDMMKLHLFDYILANPDRAQENYLVKYNKNSGLSLDEGNQPQIIAIDHGVAFSQHYYNNTENFKGPYFHLTVADQQSKKSTPTLTPIPEQLLDKIDQGQKRKDELTAKLAAINPDIAEHDLDALWDRISDLVKYGHFIDRNNRVAIHDKLA